MEVSKTTSPFDVPGRGRLCVSLEAVFLLLQVIIPMMTLWPHSLKLKVDAIQQ
jgi:hypothetical protein